MSNNKWIVGDYRENLPPKETSLMIADPVYGTSMVDDIHSLGIERGISSIVFMWPEDIHDLTHAPQQICFWTKPVSTKNTKKNYSRFVEIISINNCEFYNYLHWSARTGIFTDSLIENKSHPWKKPHSLIEKLILNHYSGKGLIYDPCAGSGVVHDICSKYGIDSLSIEIDEIYGR